MEKYTHTPGPWFYLSGSVWADPDMKVGIATRISISPVLPHIRDRNLRLCSAAPDLLKACLEAQDIIRQHNLLSTASEQDRRETLERLFAWMNGPRLAAIAKAEADPE